MTAAVPTLLARLEVDLTQTLLATNRSAEDTAEVRIVVTRSLADTSRLSEAWQLWSEESRGRVDATAWNAALTLVGRPQPGLPSALHALCTLGEEAVAYTQALLSTSEGLSALPLEQRPLILGSMASLIAGCVTLRGMLAAPWRRIGPPTEFSRRELTAVGFTALCIGCGVAALPLPWSRPVAALCALAATAASAYLSTHYESQLAAGVRFATRTSTYAASILSTLALIVLLVWQPSVQELTLSHQQLAELRHYAGAAAWASGANLLMWLTPNWLLRDDPGTRPGIHYRAALLALGATFSLVQGCLAILLLDIVGGHRGVVASEVPLVAAMAGVSMGEFLRLFSALTMRLFQRDAEQARRDQSSDQ